MVGQKQREWLAKDLETVDKATPLVVFSHSRSRRSTRAGTSGPRTPGVPRHGRTAFTLRATLFPRGEFFGVSGLASHQVGRGALLGELQVGGVTLRNQPAVVLEREGSCAVEGEALMPLHQLSSVSFNNSEGLIVVRR